METDCPGNPHVAIRRRAARSVADRLQREDDITSLAIFGSVATGQAGPGSDLDLCATYRDTYDRRAFTVACREIGLDPDALTSSTHPATSMTGLCVDGIRIGLMLGPESELLDMAQRAQSSDRKHFERTLLSFVVAEVLFDKSAIWDGVLHRLRRAAQRHGITFQATGRYGGM